MNRPPPITITDRDLARLEALLESPAVAPLPAAAALGAELGRATVVAASAMPANIVTMNSRVRCVEEGSGREHHLVLSYPADADAAGGRVSVLAPVGSALLGLAVGQAIEWPAPDGHALRVRVTGISWQPEAHGRFDL